MGFRPGGHHALRRGNHIDAHRTDPGRAGRLAGPRGPGRPGRRPIDAPAPVRDRAVGRRGGRSPRRRALSTISARLFDANGHDRWVDLDDDLTKGLGKTRLLWVDVDERDDEAALRRIADAIGLEERDLERIHADPGRSRLIRTADRLHLTLEALEPNEDTPPKLVRREIQLVAAPNIVLTVHDGPNAAVQRFRDGLDGETRLGMLTAGDLLSSLVDEVIVGYFLVAELLEREIDTLDEEALHGGRETDVLSAIVALRRRIGFVRRTLAPHREALSTLGLPETRVEELVGRPWPGLVDRLEAAISVIEGLREGLLGTFDIHMGRVSQRANDVMRTLTLLSAVLLPAVVLAGVMGMNFKLAFFDDPNNVWMVVGSMALLAFLILAVARWRRWW
jgi:Mg2+ and Co2+ transporter CorA